MAVVEGWSGVPADTFASRLVQLRHELRLSQQEAAERCGLSQGAWSNWENGSYPRNMVEIVERIHDRLGADRAWLAWGANRLTVDFTLIEGDGNKTDPGQLELPLWLTPVSSCEQVAPIPTLSGSAAHVG